MRKIFIVAGCLFSLACTAQQKMKNKPVLYIDGSAGIAAGESGVFPVARLAAGLHQKRLSAGAGMGYDTYRYNTFTYFLDANWDIDFHKRFFLYADAGYNKVDENNSKSEFFPVTGYSGGLYFDSGLGIRFKTGKKNSLRISAGYSIKRLHTMQSYIYPCLTGDCPENTFDYRYTFSRLETRIGWVFQSGKSLF